MTVWGAVLLSVLGGYIAAELHASSPVAAKWVVVLCSRAMRGPHRLRYQEEWTAEVERFDGRGFAALFFALRVLGRLPGLWLATRRLAPPVDTLLDEFDGLRFLVHGRPDAIRWAACCMPLPGDDLLATNKAVHRADCSVISGFHGPTYPATWVGSNDDRLSTRFFIPVRSRLPLDHPFSEEVRRVLADFGRSVRIQKSTGKKTRFYKAKVFTKDLRDALLVAEKLNDAGIKTPLPRIREKYERERRTR